MSNEQTTRMVAIKLEDLLDHEWSHHGKCPVCDDVGPSETDAPGCTYHAADCWLGNAIKEALKEVGNG